MPKNTTINIRVDSEVKEQAGEILASLGLSLSQAFNLMLYQVRSVRGLPFEIKQRLPIELKDGHGSYICEFGHVHDYGKFDFGAIEDGEAELIGPFESFEDYKKSLEEKDDDDEI